MAAVQLNFTLRTSAHCKSVHLLGSWDNYNGQLPLSKDATKAGGWKGTFRFQGKTLKQGQRYWYYYIIDGYHVSHDPARDSVIEPTTGRKLNVLDIPSGKPAAAAPTEKAVRSSRRVSDVPKGRSLSPSQIKSPAPQKPHASAALRSETFAGPTVEQLAARFAAASVDDEESEEDSDEDSDSDSDSDVPSLSSTSSCCTCERYGITRAGARVKLDCGGARCGYSDSSECSSESEDEVHLQRATRRQGVVVRK
jgi:hypothetical protein